MNTLVREASPILAAEIRRHSRDYMAVPSAFAVLWAESLPEDVLLSVLELCGVPQERARPLLARFVSSGWLTHAEVAPQVHTFAVAGPIRVIFEKVMSPDLTVEWSGAFQQVIVDLDRDPQSDFADQVRYLAELVGFFEVRPGVHLGFTPMHAVVDPMAPIVKDGNLLESGQLQVSESTARRILRAAWDFESFGAGVARKRELLRAASPDDSELDGAGAVSRLLDLYLERTLLISGAGRIPECIRPHRLGIWKLADEYAARLDMLDGITGPIITEAVAQCAHADRVIARDDDSPQGR